MQMLVKMSFNTQNVLHQPSCTLTTFF